MKPWTARRLANLSRNQASVMALLIVGLVFLLFGFILLLSYLRAPLMGFGLLDSAEDIAAFQASGLNSGAALAYTGARKLPGHLVLTENRANTLNVSLPYLYVEAPIGVDQEHTFLNLYRLTGEDYQVLLVSKKELSSPVFVSMEYSDFYPEWKDAYLDGSTNGYVFAASASPLPFLLVMTGVGLVLLGILCLLLRLKPLWHATPFGRQLAKWGHPDDVERDLDASLAYPLFESGSLLLTDRWLILGERRHGQRPPVLTKPECLLSAQLCPEEDDETKLLLTLPGEAEEEQVWVCYLTDEEASRLAAVWSKPPLLEQSDAPASSC